MNDSSYHIFFSNLSSPLRIKIISALRKSPLSVTELSKAVNEEQSNVSHSLKALRCCNIVNSEIKGKKRIYSLNKKTIVPILSLIDKHSQTFCKGKCNCDICGK